MPDLGSGGSIEWRRFGEKSEHDDKQKMLAHLIDLVALPQRKELWSSRTHQP